MRDWVHDFSANPTVRDKAVNLTFYIPRSDYAGKVHAIFDWVKSNIKYIPDPTGIEMVHWPTQTMSQSYGDCDDHATLVAALLASIGVLTKFVAVGFEPGVFVHVFPEALIGRRWVALDTTEPDKPMGWRPPGVVSVFEMPN